MSRPRSRFKSSLVITIFPFLLIASMGAPCAPPAQPVPPGPTDDDCLSPNVNTNCATACNRRDKCFQCCGLKHPNNEEDEDQCKQGCNGLPAAIVIRIPVGSDAYSAVADGQPASNNDTYDENDSNLYADASCIAGAAASAAEDSQPAVADAIFELLPSYMDTADTRGVLSSMTPCERFAVLADVIANLEDLESIDDEAFEDYRKAFDDWALARAIAIGQTDSESVRDQFNKSVTEYWYRNAVILNAHYIED